MEKGDGARPYSDMYGAYARAKSILKAWVIAEDNYGEIIKYEWDNGLTGSYTVGGDTALLTMPDTFTNVSWLPGTEWGNHLVGVKVTDDDNNVTFDTLLVILHPALSEDTTTQDTIIQESFVKIEFGQDEISVTRGETVSLIPTVSGGSGMYKNYEWKICETGSSDCSFEPSESELFINTGDYSASGLEATLRVTDFEDTVGEVSVSITIN